MLDLIQREFRRSKLSISALSKRTEVPYASCHGMMTRKSYNASLATVQKVVDALGLTLTPKHRTKGH